MPAEAVAADRWHDRFCHWRRDRGRRLAHILRVWRGPRPTNVAIAVFLVDRQVADPCVQNLVRPLQRERHCVVTVGEVANVVHRCNATRRQGREVALHKVLSREGAAGDDLGRDLGLDPAQLELLRSSIAERMRDRELVAVDDRHVDLAGPLHGDLFGIDLELRVGLRRGQRAASDRDALRADLERANLLPSHVSPRHEHRQLHAVHACRQLQRADASALASGLDLAG